MKRDQKGNMQLWVIIIIIIGIIVGVYLVQQRTNFLPKAFSPQNEELTILSDELDKVDLESIDAGLKQNDNDLNNF